MQHLLETLFAQVNLQTAFCYFWKNKELNNPEVLHNITDCWLLFLCCKTDTTVDLSFELHFSSAYVFCDVELHSWQIEFLSFIFTHGTQSCLTFPESRSCGYLSCSFVIPKSEKNEVMLSSITCVIQCIANNHIVWVLGLESWVWQQTSVIGLQLGF